MEVASSYKWELVYFFHDSPSVVLRLLDAIEDPPERVWFPFIPGGCRIWLNCHTKFTLRPRRSGGKYCMDLYDGEREVHREVGGEFKFNVWVSLSPSSFLV